MAPGTGRGERSKYVVQNKRHRGLGVSQDYVTGGVPQLSVLEVSPLEKELKITHSCLGKKQATWHLVVVVVNPTSTCAVNPPNPIAVAASSSDSPRF